LRFAQDGVMRDAGPSASVDLSEADEDAALTLLNASKIAFLQGDIKPKSGLGQSSGSPGTTPSFESGQALRHSKRKPKPVKRHKNDVGGFEKKEYSGIGRGRGRGPGRPPSSVHQGREQRPYADYIPQHPEYSSQYPPQYMPQQYPPQYMPQQYPPQYMPQQYPPQYMPQQYPPQTSGYYGYPGGAGMSNPVMQPYDPRPSANTHAGAGSEELFASHPTLGKPRRPTSPRKPAQPAPPAPVVKDIRWMQAHLDGVVFGKKPGEPRDLDVRLGAQARKGAQIVPDVGNRQVVDLSDYSQEDLMVMASQTAQQSSILPTIDPIPGVRASRMASYTGSEDFHRGTLYRLPDNNATVPSRNAHGGTPDALASPKKGSVNYDALSKNISTVWRRDNDAVWRMLGRQEPPIIDRVQINYLRMILVVDSLGGYRDVVQNDMWAQVAEKFGLGGASEGGREELKTLYQQYVEPMWSELKDKLPQCVINL
jgi:hypothetical protein